MATSASNPEGASAGTDHALTPVPEADRQGAWSLSVVLFGFTFFSATMMAGGQIGAALGLGPALWNAVFWGNALLAAYASVLAVVAYRSGLSTVLMARYCFGTQGQQERYQKLSETAKGEYGTQ